MRPAQPRTSAWLFGETDLPYSKGVMARMLIAAGLAPAYAYDLARRVESDLALSGDLSASRGRVLELAERALLAEDGMATITRLRRLRDLHDLDRPLIVLVGGSTGTGKSSVSTEIAHRLGITRVASTDFVRQTMRAFFSAKCMPSIHYSSFEAGAAMAALGRDADDAVILGFLEQSRNVLIGVDALVQRAITEGLSMVLEGVHLVPGLMPTPVTGAVIVPCLLTVPDQEQHADRFWLRDLAPVENRPAQRYLRSLENIRLIDHDLVRRARGHDVAVIENRVLEHAIDEVAGLVFDAVGEAAVPISASVSPNHARFATDAVVTSHPR